MKLPRLQYTYVVFLSVTTYDDLTWDYSIEVNGKRISKMADIRNIEYDENKKVDSVGRRFRFCAITNYKLLSVRILWR